MEQSGEETHNIMGVPLKPHPSGKSERPIRSKSPVGDSGVSMRMKPGIISEGVDHFDHARCKPLFLPRSIKQFIQPVKYKLAHQASVIPYAMR